MLALSPDARHAARRQAAAPRTYAAFCRVMEARMRAPSFLGGEVTPLYRRLRALEIELSAALAEGREAPEPLLLNAAAVARRAEAEARA